MDDYRKISVSAKGLLLNVLTICPTEITSLLLLMISPIRNN
jgi:hypothetical protein